VRAVGEKLRRAVKALKPLISEGGIPFQISISVGGVSASHPDLNAVDLIRVADSALYAAKRRGRDAVCVADDDPSAHQLSLEMNRHEQAHSPAR
jgi:PleD family two-component response regulator